MAGSSTGGSLISDTKLKQLYTLMLHCRLLTEHARRLGGRRRNLYSASLGQEAIVTGCGVDLRPRDTVILAPQQPIAGLIKGAPIQNLIAGLYVGGSASDLQRNDVLPPASDIAGQLQLAADVATGAQQERKGHVVMAFAAMPASGLDSFQPLFKQAVKRTLPLLVVVQNNPWGRSQKNNALPPSALKMQIDGLTNIVVDGNDVVAVYRVAYESLSRVRQGDGPVLIEAKAYHQDGRTTPQVERDPLMHMERYLSAKKLFNVAWKNQLIQHFSRDVDSAVQALDRETTRYLRASHTPAND